MPCPEKFRDSLEIFHVEPDMIKQITEGYEDLVTSSPKTRKAAFFKRAIDLMNEHMQPEMVKEILEWNACCKSGSREKASKKFAKETVGCTLEEKLIKIAEVPYMGRPVLNKDGTITIYAVYHADGEKYQCACSNFNKVKRDYPVSKNYCFCCAGHFKYHYEIMLGVKLNTIGIESSPLDSNGENPCVIRYEIR